MPVLQNPRHESFAQLRAKGALLNDAYEDAGFTPDKANASRMAHRREVADRIAELRGETAELAAANCQAVIAALMQMAKASQANETPAAVKERRLTLLDAWRLSTLFARERADERGGPLPWRKQV